MKYFLIVAFSLLCMASSFWSCQKEDLGNLDGIFSDTTQAGPVSEMTARINGVPWSASYYDISLAPGNPGQIIVTGQADNGQTVSLVITNSKQGDYLMNKLSKHVATYYPDTVSGTAFKSNYSLSTGGTVSVDTIDTVREVMSGQFNFIGGDSLGATVNITDGAFINLGYINLSKNVEFSANVNGKSWTTNSVIVTDPLNTNVITITAMNANGQKMILSFPASVKARKLAYPLTQSGTYKASYLDNGYTLVPDTGSIHNVKPKIACSMKITSNTTTSNPRNIKGVFSFYAVPSTNLNQVGSRITAGQFNVNY